MILILSGVSCSGKTTVAQHLAEEYGFQWLTTLTTRPPRIGEVGGRDYFFISEKEFALREQLGRVILPVVYRGYHYGIPTTYFLPTFDSKATFVTILLPVGIPVVKQQIRIQGSYQIVLSIYLEPESQDFLRICYERKTGLPFVASEHTKDNLQITTGRSNCDYKVINSEGQIDEVVSQIMNIVRQTEGKSL